MAMEGIRPEQILINQLKSAYRKYKTQIYYDNHSTIQRLQLAEFEKNMFSNLSNNESTFFDEEKINKFFKDLAKKVMNNDFKEFFDDVGIIAFPKKMESDDSKVISNYNESSSFIKQIHYFIDLPVEAHILGVLWILRCGYVLDDRLYKNCYGNRLNKHLIDSFKERNIWENWNFSNKFSPFLFEPYYKNYQSWRDNALDSVKNLLDNDKHAIMISLDFKNYYYSSSIDFDLLWKDIKDGERLIHEQYPSNDKIDIKEYQKINKYLTDFVETVFKIYHEKFYINYDNSELPFIPLGFLPSMIIANWNLQGFDQAILEDTHPSYYGRYVDDILIVLDSHEKSKTYGEQHFSELSANDIVKKYFTENSACHPLNKIFIFEKDNNIDNDKSNKKESEDEIIKVCNIKHRIHKKDCFHYENLQIQSTKVKLYSFSHENSTAIIDNFKKEIAKNSSEFKLMKDSDKLFAEFEDKLFEIDYVESINKLNNIKSVKINKFEISKLMSGVLNSVVFSSEKIDRKIIDKVIEAFNSNIFEFFTLWEKLFTLLYVNGNENDLKNVIEIIFNKINQLEFKDEDSKYSINENIYVDCEYVKKSLKNYLFSTVVRVLSLKSSKLYEELVSYKNKYDETNNFLNYSFNFIFSSMVNNSYMKYPIQNTFFVQNLITRNLNNNAEKINYNLINKNYNNCSNTIFNGFCYPRYVKLHEVILNDIYNDIYLRGGKTDFDKKFDNLTKEYDKLNFYESYSDVGNSSIRFHVKACCDLNCYKKPDCPIDENYKSMKIGSENKLKLNVGLINTKLSMDYFENRLIGKPNLKLNRFNIIKRLINNAIENKVDLLVMPEMYIPFEWINEIIKISKVHQMAMIFGLEPIVNGKFVYNYIMTSMPFTVDNSYFETVVSCRLKNHYSPRELQLIASHHLYEPKNFMDEPEKDMQYYLYSWNGIHIVPYYCYEITDIQSRGKFKSCCDIVTVSEFNKDEIYFGNIAESLARDIYCYCIKSNTSEFGGNSIIQPAPSEVMKIIDLKGGENDYLVVQELNIDKLRKNAIKSDLVPNNKDKNLKPNPPGLNKDIIKERMHLESKYSK